MRRRSIYLASSWRNAEQPALVETLRRDGHAVYDFRNPAPGVDGFSWAEIDERWRDWTPAEYVAALEHSRCTEGFGHDWSALVAADTCLLLLPSGRSAHLEAGFAAGLGRDLFILLRPECFEPELMYRFAAGRLFVDLGDLRVALVDDSSLRR